MTAKIPLPDETQLAPENVARLKRLPALNVVCIEFQFRRQSAPPSDDIFCFLPAYRQLGDP